MKKNQKGFSIVEGLLIIVIIGLIGFAGWYVYSSTRPQTKANSKNTSQSGTESNNDSAKLPSSDAAIVVAKNFIKGMQDADKSLVDNLTSPTFKATLKAESGTESFYDTCIQGGTGVDSCIASFKAFDLSKVTVDVIDSSVESGEKGKTVTLQANSTLQGKLINIGYDFHLSPKGSSWQVDDTQESQGSPN